MILFCYIYPTNFIFSKYSLVTTMFNVIFPTSSSPWLLPCASTHCVFPGHLFTVPCIDTMIVACLPVVPGFNQVPMDPAVAITIVGVVLILRIGFFHEIFILMLGRPLPGLDIVHICIYCGHMIGEGGNGIIMHVDGIVEHDNLLFAQCDLLRHVDLIIVFSLYLAILNVVYYAMGVSLPCCLTTTSFHPYISIDKVSLEVVPCLDC